MKKSLLIEEFKKGMEFPIKLYDKNNNQIYYENSNCHWWKREYDENNNEIYFENSRCDWWKREYDENNNEIYFETSFGGIILDKRHKQIKELTMEEICKELGYEVKIKK